MVKIWPGIMNSQVFLIDSRKTLLSIPTLPIDHIYQRTTGQISTKILAKQFDAAMVRLICSTGNMGSNQNALVIPETSVRVMLKLTDIDIQGNPPKLSGCKRFDEGVLIDDFPPCHIDQDGSGLHGFEGFSINQFRGLGSPLTTNDDKVALSKKL